MNCVIEVIQPKMKPTFWGLPPPKNRNKKNKRHLNNTIFSSIRLRSYITDGWVKVELSKLQENISQKLDARTLNHTTPPPCIEYLVFSWIRIHDIHWLPKKQKPNARHPNLLPTSLKTADLCQDKNAFTFSAYFLTTL